MRIAELAVEALRIGRRAGITWVLAVVALLAGSVVFTSGVASASSCQYHRSGSHWVCVTPGAFCPKAAHGHYGLDRYNLSRKYWCENSHGWRWEPRK
jgi:hypothetical protein